MLLSEMRFNSKGKSKSKKISDRSKTLRKSKRRRKCQDLMRRSQRYPIKWQREGRNLKELVD